MKKLLIIAYYFPPIAVSGTFRPLNFCRYLDRYGWIPRVLATTPDSIWPPLPNDERLCERLPPIVRIDRVSHRNPRQVLNRVGSRVRAKLHFGSQPLVASVPTKINQASTRSSRPSGLALVDLVLDRLLGFPDPQCFWRNPAFRRLVLLCSKSRPDAVFATGKPWTGLMLGKMIAEHIGVPFVADFRDPWVGNPSSVATSSFVRAAKNLEGKICRTADRVITTTSELRDRLKTDYPEMRERFVTITNGFDGSEYSSLTGAVAPKTKTAPCNKSLLEVSHFGTIYGTRNPLALLMAMKELLHDEKIARGQIRVKFVGAWELAAGVSERLIDELEIAGLAVREPPIPHSDCLEQMSKSDILLLLQPGYPLQIPAKIYEYVAVGRPILLLGGEGATANLLEKHGLGMYCRNEVEDIKKLLLKLIQGRTRIDPPSTQDRDRFDYRNLTGELATLLDQVCAGN